MMNSRELYKAVEHLNTTITWSLEWIHFGADSEIDFELIKRTIHEFFGPEDIYLVHERTNSRKIQPSLTIDDIQDLLGTANFQLWNLELTKAIEFNRIGVMRTGRKRDLQHRL